MSGPVLCAIDVDHPDHEAPVLVRAGQIARLDRVGLAVLTVMPEFHSAAVAGIFPEDFYRQALDEAKARLSAFVAGVLGAEANAAARHLVATGLIHEQVLRAAKDEAASLIVIGSHRPTMRDLLIGPNAAHVVRQAACSVFVVRPDSA